MKHSRWPVFSVSSSIISWLLFSLWLFIDVPSVYTDQCLQSLSTPGWTVPAGDVVLKEGDTLNITCYLDPIEAKAKNYTSSNLFFTRSNSERISSEYVLQLNDTAVRLVITNLTSLNDWFYCKLVNEKPLNNQIDPQSSLEMNSSPALNETVVCMNMVAVGKKPKDIENYSCISYDWSELNCSWTVPNNTVKTTYSIFYSPPRRAGRGVRYSCPPENNEIVTNRCVWTEKSEPTYRKNFEYLHIIFVGNNTFGDNTQTFKFHNFAHIIPAKPRSLVASEKTSTSIYLKWNIDNLSLFDKGWVYNVSYIRSSADGWNSTVYNHKDLHRDKDNVFLNVTDLKYPNMVYDFRVKMRSAVASGDLGWSEPAVTVVKTKPCPPYRSPRIDIGSFEIVPQEVERADRYVFIYWQPLHTLEHNGDEFRYEFMVFEEDKEIDLKPVVNKGSYAKYKITFKSHKFLIYSVNKEGRAENSSVIYVPRKDDAIRAPAILTKIDYGNGLYELSWKPSEVLPITNYTAFWCESVKEYPYQCDGYIDWISVPANVSKYNFTVNTSKAYQFAVSANADTGSSGMIWASCTVLHDRVSKIKNVWIDRAESYYVFIRWKLECTERIDALKGYYIYYCKTESLESTNCSSRTKNVTIYGDLDTDHGNVTELEPFTYYKMSMAMFTSNSTGPKSDSIMLKTKDGKPDVSKLQVEGTVTNTSISLTWVPLNVTNGVLQYYLVTYNQNEARCEANATQITLENLTSFETYHIKIQACTIICSEPFGPILVTTKIGKPGPVMIKNPQNINASHVVITWGRPDIPGGPHPEYRLRIRYHGDSHKEDKELKTAENSTLVDLTSCTSGSFTVQVRAENTDEKSGEVFPGDWSNEIYNTCSNGSAMSPFLKLMLIFAGVLFISSVFASWGRKGLYKCQQMKKVEVTLPAEFTVPPLFPGESKECEIYEDFGMQPSKSVEEFYLVDKTTTELTFQDDCSRVFGGGMITSFLRE